jgi:hypothetical protein
LAKHPIPDLKPAYALSKHGHHADDIASEDSWQTVFDKETDVAAFLVVGIEASDSDADLDLLGTWGWDGPVRIKSDGLADSSDYEGGLGWHGCSELVYEEKEE